MDRFKLVSPFKPAGDQPEAIRELVEGVRRGLKTQALLGVTGSGKTFVMSQVIAELNRPALILSPNKVLAAQLYAEFKSFFPENAVEYFISYYDYYQPEAYVPSSDTYIEKDASINEHIDRLRLKATTSLLARRDSIVVASVSCIYNIGDPENYKSMCVGLEAGAPMNRVELSKRLVSIYYERNDTAFERGKFRVRGNVVDIHPSYSESTLRVELDGDSIRRITELHAVSGKLLAELPRVYVYPSKHFVNTQAERDVALVAIQDELKERLAWLNAHGKLLEAQRLEQRTRYDMEMLAHLGFCHGIENYSRHLSGRAPGERPFCLLDYFPKDYLMFIDESHVSLPQVRGMHEGDRVRKQTLVDYGWRLPSALDNRPLKLNEFESLLGQTVYVSATPGPYELARTGGAFVEMIVRPTGLIDPEVVVAPTEGQLDLLIGEIETRAKRKERVLVTTLTKRTAEDLSAYLTTKNLEVRYLHSDIDSLTRIDILKDLRKGAFDVLVGINLLREGLDLPEVSLVAILDADNEGFLRSETTLIQIAGRAARNVNGRVLLFADRRTGSMERALAEMERRRAKQLAYNKEHGVTPKTIVKAVHDLEEFQYGAKKEGLSIIRDVESQPLNKKNLPNLIGEVEKRMKEAADNLDFELAAALRDQLFELKELRVGAKTKAPAGERGPRPSRKAKKV